MKEDDDQKSERNSARTANPNMADIPDTKLFSTTIL